MADTSNAAAWEKQFKELLEYKAITGTCLVPKVFPEKPVSLRLLYFVLGTHLVDLANIYVICSVCLIGSLANDLRCG
jgi:hypothetical protein